MDDEVIVLTNSDKSVIKVIGHVDGVRSCSGIYAKALLSVYAWGTKKYSTNGVYAQTTSINQSQLSVMQTNTARSLIYVVSPGLDQWSLTVDAYSKSSLAKTTYQVNLWIEPFISLFTSYGFNKTECSVSPQSVFCDTSGDVYINIDYTGDQIIYKRYAPGFVRLNNKLEFLDTWTHNYGIGAYYTPPSRQGGSIASGNIFLADGTDGTLYYPSVRVLDQTSYASIAVKALPGTAYTLCQAVLATATTGYAIYYVTSSGYSSTMLCIFDTSTLATIKTVTLEPPHFSVGGADLALLNSGLVAFIRYHDPNGAYTTKMIKLTLDGTIQSGAVMGVEYLYFVTVA